MLSARLKELLLALRITETEFAKSIGFSSAYVSMLLNGKKSNPSSRFYEAVSREFCVSIPWFQNGEGSMFEDNHSHASSFERNLLAKYWQLPPVQRRAVNDIIDAMLNAET